MVVDYYPVLGENLAVDLANSWYVMDGEGFDFLGTPELVAGWWDEVRQMAAVQAMTALSGADHRRLVALRDAVRAILLSVLDGGRAGEDALAVVTACVTRSPVRRTLAAPGRSAPVVTVIPGEGAAGILGLLADACVQLFAGPEVPVIRRCEGPGCPMLFVRHHARRRHCHSSCAHRGRQARYYRRQLSVRHDEAR
ncbi:CGNR zinc finger domain-containing protein [Actinokineospora sp.]|uniref:CGNR zinc finger domain-containing protein n=1 Tax=Actinokineospora sp. TaxID=1872133 RepID=UPI004037622C